MSDLPIVSTVEAYKKYHETGRPAIVEGLSARILRGQFNADFETLTNDPLRKIVMTVGADGAQKILTQSHFQQLLTIGYPTTFIDDCLEKGLQFRLVVFEENENVMPATWENLPKIISKAYPDLAPIAKYFVYVQKHSFEDYEKASGFDYYEVQNQENAIEDSRYMTYDRFFEIVKDHITTDASKSELKLRHFREFMFFTLWLNKLYKGDGLTYDEEGNSGLQESFVLNLPIKELGNTATIRLDVPTL